MKLHQSPRTWTRRLRIGQPRPFIPTIPAIVVRGQNGANLIESHNPEVGDGTFFGWMTAGATAGIERTFSIHNAGTSLLELGGIGIEGDGAEEFEVIAAPAECVNPGGSTTFTLRYRGAEAGKAIALVLISSNDATERPYLFLVEGHAGKL